MLEQIDEFDDFLPFLLNCALPQSCINAVPRMNPQQLCFSLGQGGFRRLNLMQDIDAVPILFEHANHTFYLTFDPVEALYDRLAVLGHIYHLSLQLDGYPRGV